MATAIVFNAKLISVDGAFTSYNKLDGLLVG
jgi:hypothetical protein